MHRARASSGNNSRDPPDRVSAAIAEQSCLPAELRGPDTTIAPIAAGLSGAGVYCVVLENAVLRHQVNVLRRHSKRPKLHLVDRLKLLLGARWLPSWRRAIVPVQPETVLRWHRAGFRLQRRSRSRKTSPLPRETIT